MEHDDEKKIREKVLIAEEQPVRWNRDDVWNRMPAQTLPSKRRVVPYYVAASVALFVAIVVYTEWHLQQNTIASKIKTLEMSIDALHYPTASEYLQANENCDVATDPPVPHAPRQNTPVTKKETPIALGWKTEKEKLPEIAEPILDIHAPDSVVEQPLVSEEKTLPKKRTTTTIIVVAPEKAITEVPKITRHKKFHLFRSPDRSNDSTNDKGTDILVARIN